MARLKSQGKFSEVLQSWLAILTIGARVTFSHLLGKQLVREWSRDFEISNLFWRRQFTRALLMKDIDEGRAVFDSLQTYSDKNFDTQVETGGAK